MPVNGSRPAPYGSVAGYCPHDYPAIGSTIERDLSPSASYLTNIEGPKMLGGNALDAADRSTVEWLKCQMRSAIKYANDNGAKLP